MLDCADTNCGYLSEILDLIPLNQQLPLMVNQP